MADDETAVVRFSAPDDDDIVTQAQPPVSQPLVPPQRLIQARPPSPVPSPQKPQKDPAPSLPATDEIDMSFLDRLANSRKLKTRTANSEYMAEHEDLDLYAEDDLETARQIDRRRRLKKEAEAEAEEQHEPIKAGGRGSRGSDASSVSSKDSSLAQPAAGGRGRNDMDDALFASLVAGKAATSASRTKKAAPRPKSKPKPKSKKEAPSSGDGSEASDVSSLMRDPFAKPKKQPTKAELYLEERNHKASRVARINQLEAKGIECSLPPDIDWMSLPLSQLDDCQVLMETRYRRKGKIQKMRAGFFALNKLAVWGACEHPGPEWLKFYKVKGFDRKIADEIDEFDDDLEKLWDMWFGESGEMNPLLSIALIEASMLGNYVMSQSGQATVKQDVRPPGTGGGTGGALGGAASGILGGLMSMLNNNPQMSGAVQQTVASAATAPPPPAQQQIAQQPVGETRPAPALFSRNYGAPPVTVDQPPMDIGLAHQMQRQTQQIESLERRLQIEAEKKAPNGAGAATSTEALRTMMDSVVENHAKRPQSEPGPDDVDDGAKAPIAVSMPTTPARRGRGGRGRGRGAAAGS